MASTPNLGSPIDRVTREIAMQAELLALHFALDGPGAAQASAALLSLSRELRDAGRSLPDAQLDAPSIWRLED